MVGLLALALPAWLAWLKPAVFGVAAEGNRGPSATRNEPLTDSEGITAAEAEALLPPVPGPVRTSASRKPWVDQVQAPSPYPPDPRRVGGIPAGTTPLPARHAPSTPQPTANDPAPVGRGAAKGLDRAGHGAVAHLASAESGTDPFAAVVFDTPSARAADSAPAGRKPSAQELTPRVEQPPPLAQPKAVDPAPRASWEENSVEVEESPALHVDAYGTPRDLVAQLRSANETARADLDDYEGEDDELGDPKPLDPETAQAVLDRLRAAKQEEAVLPVSAQAQAPSKLDEDIEFEGISPDIEDEDEDEDEDEEDDQEVDEEDIEDAEVEEVWNEDESDEDESEEEDSDDVDGAPDEIARAPARVASDELRPVTPGARAKSKPQPSLFESELEPQPVKAGPRNASKPAQAFAAPQRQATPATAGAGSGSAQPASSSATPIDDLVFRAGCLFLERQRVAVSMLQKDFGMDFKRATSVLDQLQDAGLIGPYLGGQRRDILMTLEQWKARAAVEVSPAN